MHITSNWPRSCHLESLLSHGSSEAYLSVLFTGGKTDFPCISLKHRIALPHRNIEGPSVLIIYIEGILISTVISHCSGALDSYSSGLHS